MSGNGWQAFRIVPSDLLYFRDGKPSSLGADHYLRSLFPPNPSTLYGALRTRRLLDEEVELAGLDQATWNKRLSPALIEELGQWAGFGSLEVRGPWLVRGTDEPLLPVPADVGIIQEGSLRSKDERPALTEVVRFRSGDTAAESWSHPLALLDPFARNEQPWTGAEPRSAAGDWWLKPAGLATWRTGGVPEKSDLVHRTELWLDEPRTGVGLQSEKRASQEGLLYTFGYIRLLPGISLGFEAKGSRLQAGSLLRLGGEGRTASLEVGPSLARWAEPAAGEGRFGLCFVTPALSAAGGYPPGFSADRLEGILGGRRCRLVAAAVPRVALFGGWDLARKFPKTLRRAIPSGSVFHFESVAEEKVSASALDGLCYSDFSEEQLARQGFGLAVAGLSR